MDQNEVTKHFSVGKRTVIDVIVKYVQKV